MRSPSPRWSTRARGIATCLAAGLLAAGCSINEPELPTFVSGFVVPLGEERLEIRDALDDVEYLTVMPDSVTVGFLVDGDPDTVALDLDLAVDVAVQDIHAELGEFSLDIDAPVSLDRTLAELVPAEVRLIIEPRDGTLAPVPPFSFVDQADEPTDIENCTRAELASGQLTATVDNGLSIPISGDGPPYQVTLEVRDPATGALVTSVVFDPVAAGTQQQQTRDLTGVVLPDSVTVRLIGGSPGSGGQAVLIDLQAGIAVDLSFDQLRVAAADAAVPAQSFQTEFLTELPDQYEITEAAIGDGSLPVAVTNELPLPATATVTWAEVVDDAGEPLVRTYQLAPFANLSESVDFTGLRIVAPGAGSTTVDVLTATVEVTSPGSSGQTVTLTSDQGIAVAIGGGRLAFATVTGRVPEQAFELDPVAAEIDLPEELAGLELTHAALILSVVSSAGVPAVADLVLTGTSAAGVTETLHTAAVLAAAGIVPAVTEIVVDQDTDPALLVFLNNLPESITLAGHVTVGGPDYVGTVSPTDYAAIAWRVEAPVEVRVREGGARLVTDPRYVDLDTDVRDLIRDHARGAVLDLTVANRFPLGLELNVLFSPDTTTVHIAPILTVGPITVAAALRDPIDHTAVATTVSDCRVVLTADQAQLLGTEGLVTVIRVDLPYEDGNPARVLSTDHVTVTGVVDLEVEISRTD